MKKSFLTSFFAIVVLLGVAQKNVVKFNPLGLVYTNLPFQYERKITPFMSASLGFGMVIPKKKLPTQLEQTIGDTISSVIESIKITGYQLTPEIKFYTKANALEGFYISIYGRYMVNKLNAPLANYPYQGQYYNIDMNAYLNEIGGGFQLGYQWIVNDHFAIDWYFFGPRFSVYTAAFEFKEQANNTATIPWNDVAVDLGDQFTGFKVSTTNNSAKVSYPVMAGGIRFGLSLGYAF